MDTCKPLLYSWYRSSCAWRVRIALEYKGVDYDIKAIHLLEDEQKQKEFLSVNPMGQVPVLVIDGVMLFQSLAIMEYLDDLYPEKSILPKDSLQRARVREICNLICSGIQPIQNLSVQNYHSENIDERLKWAQYWITRGFHVLEKMLLRSGGNGKFCFGKSVTMADCCLVPQVENAFRFKMDLSLFPTITSIHKNLSTLPAFQAAHAFVQPDCPLEFRLTKQVFIKSKL